MRRWDCCCVSLCVSYAVWYCIGVVRLWRTIVICCCILYLQTVTVAFGPLIVLVGHQEGSADVETFLKTKTFIYFFCPRGTSRPVLHHGWSLKYSTRPLEQSWSFCILGDHWWTHVDLVIGCICIYLIQHLSTYAMNRWPSLLLVTIGKCVYLVLFTVLLAFWVVSRSFLTNTPL